MQLRVLLVAALTAIVMAPLVWAACGLNFLRPEKFLRENNRSMKLELRIGEQLCPQMPSAGVDQHSGHDLAGQCGPARFPVVGEGGRTNQVDLKGTKKPELVIHSDQRARSGTEEFVRTLARNPTEKGSNAFCRLAPKLELLANSVSSMADTRPMGAAASVPARSQTQETKVIRNKSHVSAHSIKQRRKELSVHADGPRTIDFYVGPHIIVLCSHMTTVEKRRVGCP